MHGAGLRNRSAIEPLRQKSGIPIYRPEFTHVIYIAASAEAVYTALTSPEDTRCFLGRAAGWPKVLSNLKTWLEKWTCCQRQHRHFESDIAGEFSAPISRVVSAGSRKVAIRPRRRTAAAMNVVSRAASTSALRAASITAMAVAS